MDWKALKEYILENTPGEIMYGSKGGAKVGKIENRNPGDLDYWHDFYPPLYDSDIEQIEQIYSFKLPELLKSFYKTTDGLRLSGVLDIYGWGSRVDEAGQAVFLGYGNEVEKIENKPDNMLVIGSIHNKKTDQFDVILIDETGKIYVNNGALEFSVKYECDNMLSFLQNFFTKYNKKWF